MYVINYTGTKFYGGLDKLNVVNRYFIYVMLCMAEITNQSREEMIDIAGVYELTQFTNFDIVQLSERRLGTV